MTGVGAYLVRRRMALGLSLETLATETRIAPRILQALEEDRLDGLPPAVYVRGFIRVCCDRLGAAPEEALRLYEAQRSAAGLPDAVPLPAVAAVLRVPADEEPGRTARARRVRLVVAGIALVVIAAGAQRMGLLGEAWPWRLLPGAASARGGAIEGPRAPRPAPPALGPRPAPPGDVALAEPDGSGSGTGRVLVLRAEETTWVRVVPESGRASEALLAPGAVREWRSGGRFVVTVGNAGGVQVELDGAPLPALGARGQVVRDVVLPPGPDQEPVP